MTPKRTDPCQNPECGHTWECHAPIPEYPDDTACVFEGAFRGDWCDCERFIPESPVKCRRACSVTRRKSFPPELRLQVFARDGGCLAPILDPGADPCQGRLTPEHVRDFSAMGGKRAPDDLEHVLTLCLHHNSDGWASGHKRLEREYLRSVNEGKAA